MTTRGLTTFGPSVTGLHTTLTGEAGPQGPQEPQGIQGIQGIQGPPGPQVIPDGANALQWAQTSPNPTSWSASRVDAVGDARLLLRYSDVTTSDTEDGAQLALSFDGKLSLARELQLRSNDNSLWSLLANNLGHLQFEGSEVATVQKLLAGSANLTRAVSPADTLSFDLATDLVGLNSIDVGIIQPASVSLRLRGSSGVEALRMQNNDRMRLLRTSSAQYDIDCLSGTGQAMRVDGELYVTTSLGVGNTAPAFGLDVSGTGRFTDDLRLEGSALLVDTGATSRALSPATGGDLLYDGAPLAFRSELPGAAPTPDPLDMVDVGGVWSFLQSPSPFTLLQTDALRAAGASGLSLQSDEGTARLTVTDGGLVGIGTVAPNSALEVVGSIGFDGSLLGLSNSGFLRLRNSAAADKALAHDASGDLTWDSAPLALRSELPTAEVSDIAVSGGVWSLQQNPSPFRSLTLENAVTPTAIGSLQCSNSVPDPRLLWRGDVQWRPTDCTIAGTGLFTVDDDAAGTKVTNLIVDTQDFAEVGVGGGPLTVLGLGQNPSPFTSLTLQEGGGQSGALTIDAAGDLLWKGAALGGGGVPDDLFCTSLNASATTGNVVFRNFAGTPFALFQGSNGRWKFGDSNPAISYFEIQSPENSTLRIRRQGFTQSSLFGQGAQSSVFLRPGTEAGRVHIYDMTLASGGGVVIGPGPNPPAGSILSISGGTVDIDGTLNATTKNFQIRHPDPAATAPEGSTRMLRHWCVESASHPGGSVQYTFSVHCGAGKAPTRVELPSWLKHLAKEPLFFVSAAGPHLGTGYAYEVDDGSGALSAFEVVGSKPGQYTVLLVAGRKDACAQTCAQDIEYDQVDTPAQEERPM